MRDFGVTVYDLNNRDDWQITEFPSIDWTFPYHCDCEEDQDRISLGFRDDIPSIYVVSHSDVSQSELADWMMRMAMALRRAERKGEKLGEPMEVSDEQT